MNKLKLEELIQSKKNIIIMLNSSWDSVSNKMDTELMRVYPLYVDSIDLIKIDVDKYPYVREFFCTNVVPALVFISNSEIKNIMYGMTSSDIIDNNIKRIYDKQV